MPRSNSLVVLIVGFVVGAVPCLAQITAGIRGTVTSQDGSPIAVAQVSVTSAATGLNRTTKTDSSGSYSFDLLPVGTYSETVAAQGFRSHEETGLILATNDVLSINVVLQVGTSTETIEVTTAPPVVNTQTSDINTLINSEQITDLPLNTRNPIELATLTTGVSQSTIVSAPTATFQLQGNSLDVDGNRNFMTQFNLDGADFRDPKYNDGLDYPNPDALEEFKFITGNYAAEFGKNPGGVMNVVVKSGTNQLHGSVWEFNRNSDLSSRNYFLPTVPFLNQNQFGFAAGGPAIKNKLFAFGSAQWLRIAQNEASTGGIPPTAAEKAGNFSGGATITDPETGLPFPSNMIPTNRIDPIATKMLNLLPLPNAPNGTSYLGAFAQPLDNYQWIIKPDYQISAKQRVSGDVFIDHTLTTSLLDFGITTVPYANTTGNPLYLSDVKSTNYIVNHVYTFTSNIMNNARFADLMLHWNSGPSGNRGPTLPDMGANFPKFPDPDVPTIYLPGRVFMDSGNISIQDSTDYQFADDLVFIKGAHNIQVGAEITHTSLNFVTTGNNGGDFLASGQVTGDPLADFELGMTPLYVSDTELSNLTQYGIAGYFQDDYRVARRITLNLGLRYQVADVWQSTLAQQASNGGYLSRGASFIPGEQSQVFLNAPAGLVFPYAPAFKVGDKGVPSGLVDTDKGNLGPRLGVDWDVFGSGKTAVRAGWGIFYATPDGDTVSLAAEAAPFFVNQYVALTSNFTNPVASLAGVFPVQFSPNLSFAPFEPMTFAYLNSGLRNAFVQQMNLTVEQQLPGRTSLQVGYVGNDTTRLLDPEQTNAAVYTAGNNSSGQPLSTLANENERRPFDQPFLPSTPFGGITEEQSTSKSRYNSLQVQLKKEASKRLTFLASYVWSHAIDFGDLTITTGGSTGIQDPSNPNSGKGLSDYDQRQRFTVSAVYELPEASRLMGSDNRIVQVLADGWEVSPIITLGSGFPFTVTTGADNSLTGVGQDRPNQVGDPDISERGRSRSEFTTEYFNVKAFVPNPTGMFGNTRRNTLIGPGTEDVDLGVYKGIRLFAETNLQLRFECFNLFNRPAFAAPDATLAAGPAFGTITSTLTAGPTRIVQIGGKIQF